MNLYVLVKMVHTLTRTGRHIGSPVIQHGGQQHYYASHVTVQSLYRMNIQFAIIKKMAAVRFPRILCELKFLALHLMVEKMSSKDET